MTQYKLDKIKEKVQEQLDAPRYEHTIGVMYTASAMAMRYGADMEKALLAGLLHDCAKCIPSDEKIKLCEKQNISISESERKNPSLLHAKLGAFLAETKYEVKETEILDAISYHTTGRPKMTLLDKIIYIADYIEPNRRQAPHLDVIRKLAFTDIDACLYKILEDSLAYLQTRSEVIDPMTEQTYLYYKKEWKEQCSWNNQS
jgi:predicted HD superfamily hydrolase involved in NAD metabolism